MRKRRITKAERMLDFRAVAMRDVWLQDNPGGDFEAFDNAATCVGTVKGQRAYMKYFGSVEGRVEQRTQELFGVIDFGDC
jgi:hypothetical protein